MSKESVSGFYDVENLEKTGLYVHTQRGYEIIDDSEDEDFTCSGSETDESESVKCTLHVGDSESIIEIALREVHLARRIETFNR